LQGKFSGGVLATKSEFFTALFKRFLNLFSARWGGRGAGTPAPIEIKGKICFFCTTKPQKLKKATGKNIYYILPKII
jgi:hypothetical protein